MTKRAASGKDPVLWVVFTSGDGWKRGFAAGVFGMRRMAKAWSLAREPFNPTLSYRVVRYVPARSGKRKGRRNA